MFTFSVATSTAISAMKRDHRLMKHSDQLHRVPDRLAKQHHRRRRHRNPEKRVQHHRHRQPERLSPRLRTLRFGVAREVGNVQAPASPSSPPSPSATERIQLETRSVVWNWLGVDSIAPKLPAFIAHPNQQRHRHHEHERRAKRLQPPDRLHAAPHHHHVQQPEAEKARPQHPAIPVRARPDHDQHRVNRAAADPRLNPEPPARHHRAQQRRQIRPAHAKRRAQETPETESRTSRPHAHSAA